MHHAAAVYVHTVRGIVDVTGMDHHQEPMDLECFGNFKYRPGRRKRRERERTRVPTTRQSTLHATAYKSPDAEEATNQRQQLFVASARDVARRTARGTTSGSGRSFPRHWPRNVGTSRREGRNRSAETILVEAEPRHKNSTGIGHFIIASHLPKCLSRRCGRRRRHRAGVWTERLAATHMMACLCRLKPRAASPLRWLGLFPEGRGCGWVSRSCF